MTLASSGRFFFMESKYEIYEKYRKYMKENLLLVNNNEISCNFAQ